MARLTHIVLREWKGDDSVNQESMRIQLPEEGWELSIYPGVTHTYTGIEGALRRAFGKRTVTSADRIYVTLSGQISRHVPMDDLTKGSFMIDQLKKITHIDVYPDGWVEASVRVERFDPARDMQVRFNYRTGEIIPIDYWNRPADIKKVTKLFA